MNFSNSLLLVILSYLICIKSFHHYHCYKSSSSLSSLSSLSTKYEISSSSPVLSSSSLSSPSPVLSSSSLSSPSSSISSSPALSSSSSLIENVDSIMMKLILEATSAYNNYNSYNNNPTMIDINKVMIYMTTWNNALVQGYVPEDNMLIDIQLHNQIMNTFISLSLPRLVQCHPDLLPSVTRSIIQMIVDYYKRLLKYQSDSDSYDDNVDNDHDSIKEELANVLGKQFVSLWGPPMTGLSILDDLYGTDHGLLISNTDSIDSVDLSLDGNNDLSSDRGYGLFDGIWKHTGWRTVNELQKKLSEITELKTFMRRVGRRVSIDGTSIKKSPPQVETSPLHSPLGVTRNNYAPFEAEDIKSSDSLTSLLPRELMLLIDTVNTTSFNSIRRRKLFNARRLEKGLLNYDRKGFVEEYSYPKPKPWKHFINLPVKAGGPLIICLDTSYSMAGPREILSKAVVLEAAIMANKENRAIYIIAFSGNNNIAEFEVPITMNKHGFKALLDFLGSSFNGGTDVTGPLKSAISLIENSAQWSNTAQWSNADIILVTDGELMLPPVNEEIMKKINHLEQTHGLEVHGLLIGRNSSVPLNYITTDWDYRSRVYDFLCKFDPLTILRQSQIDKNDNNDNSDSNDNNDNNDSNGIVVQESSYSYHSRFSTPTSLYCVQTSKSTSRFRKHFKLYASITSDEMNSNDDTSAFDNIMDIARSKVNIIINDHQNSINNNELNTMSFTFLDDILLGLNDGLIERDVETKLLLLAVICQENILFLGPPGTAKSELARRLSTILKGSYFERLLTKFTNPEEVFGPLSLEALERDLYVRKIDGYLPSANVAFLDEIFKANSAILNSLLSILNEKKFDNGEKQIKVPLLVTVAASNEIPYSEELEALYDRFLIRKEVLPISDREISSLLLMPMTSSSKYTISSSLTEELITEIKVRSDSVTIPQEVLDIIRDIRIYLRDEIDPPIYVSDRRLRKAMQLLKVSAFTCQRNYVSLVDTLLLCDILWYTPDERKTIRSFLWKKMIPDIQTYKFIYESLKLTITKSLEDKSSSSSSLSSITTELVSLSSVLAKKIVMLRSLISDFNHHVWLAATDLIQLRQALGPKAKGSADDLDKLLLSVNILIVALDNDSNRLDTVKTVIDRISTSSATSLRSESLLDDDDNNDNDDTIILSSIELSYTKKEAMKLLSKDKYQVWKKKKNSKKKSSRNNDDDDDY